MIKEHGSAGRFPGKYRGVVVDVDDPLQLGRLRATVPAVADDVQLGWALPCVPYAGKDIGLFLIPPVGSGVWIEFEGGDPGYPIWVGCWWGTGQLPAGAGPGTGVLATAAHTLTLDDTAGQEAITVKHSDGSLLEIRDDTLTFSHHGGAKITIDASGITVDAGGPKITLASSSITIDAGGQKIELGPSSVNINNSALEVR